MKREEFDNYLYDTISEIKNRLTSKGEEYANDEQFHNFIEGALRRGTTKEEYLLFLNTKHEVSRDDMVRANDIPYRAKNWNYALAHEKIHDIIAYNILLLAMIYESTKDQKEEFELPF